MPCEVSGSGIHNLESVEEMENIDVGIALNACADSRVWSPIFWSDEFQRNDRDFF